VNRWLLVLVALAALGFGSLRGRDRWQASRTLSTVERISLQMIQSGKATVPALLANAKALERAERQDPANVAIILSRGSQYLLLNRPGSAIEIYEQALALEPRPEVYLNLGRAYWLLGRKGRAQTLFAQAIRLDPFLAGQIPASLRAGRSDAAGGQHDLDRPQQ
jgi:cytochrome c-type biogenesis protein CcmH/NrfG